jgi:methylisocitrate lyase
VAEYIDNGADCIFIKALESEQEFEKFRNAVSAPLLANMTDFGKSTLLRFKQLSKLGYNIVIDPVSTFRLAMEASIGGLEQIKKRGTQEGLLDSMLTRSELYRLSRHDDHNELDPSLNDENVNR